MPGCVAFRVRKREINVDAQLISCFSLFIQSGIPAYGMPP